MNDIFRYINEEGEEEVLESTQEETAATGPLVEDVEMPKAQAAVEEPVAAALDTDVVAKKLEETVEPEPVVEEPPTTNGTATEVEDAPVAAAKIEEVPTPEIAAKEAEEEEIKESEKPKDPTPSPVITRAPSNTKLAPAPAPAQPAAPPKPLSWASRAAAAVGTAPRPAVPVVAPKTATPPAQTRTAPPPAKAAPAPTPAPAPATPAEKEKENAAPGGWQTAGSDHAKRQNRPQSVSGPPEKEGTMGYVRNVTEKVGAEELRAALGAFGHLIYFDVNRGKVRAPLVYILRASANHDLELRICRICHPRRLPSRCRCQSSPSLWRTNIR